MRGARRSPAARALSAISLLGMAMLLLPGSASAASTPPSIGPEWAAAVKSNDAFLEALINPRSEERGVYYQFQLAKNPSEFADEFTCPTEGFPAGSSLCLGITPQEGALPIRSAPAGMNYESVNIDLKNAGASLEPATTYYFRVIAARIVPTEDTTQWEEPTVFGTTQSFTTLAAEAPLIEGISVSDVTQTDATLEAQINPNGQATTYRFHLATPPCGAVKTCEQNSFPLPSGSIPAGTATETVSLDLNGAGVTLTPGQRYEFWVTATNSAGEAGSQYDSNVFMAAEEEIPLIASEGVSGITKTDAVLEATIDPRYQHGAFYQFQLVREPGEYASEILCPPPPWPGYSACAGTRSESALPIGSLCGECEILPAAQPVRLDLASAGVTLKPGTTYHFRVIAAKAVQTEDTIQWEEPSVFGQDETFTTLSLPPIEARPIPAPPPSAGGPAPVHPCLKQRHRHHRRHGHHRHHHRERCPTRK